MTSLLRPLLFPNLGRRLYSTPAPATPAEKLFGRRNLTPQRVIDTLRIDRLTKYEHVKFTGYAPNIFTKDEIGPLRSATFFHKRSQSGGQPVWHWPENAHGFLYFHPNPPGTDFTASSVRFRSTSSSDPASFHEGSDLLTPLGLPWNIPILSIATVPGYMVLRHVLLQDGILTPELLQEYQELVKKFPYRVQENVLHSIDQPFWINLDRKSFKLSALRGGIARSCVFTQGILFNSTTYPLSGGAIVKFEMSPNSKEGDRRVQLRFVDVSKAELASKASPTPHLIPQKNGGPVTKEILDRICPTEFRLDSSKRFGPMLRLLVDGHN